MKKNFKFLILSLMVALIIASPQVVQGMEPEPAKEFFFQQGTKKIPIEIVTEIVKFAAIDNYLSNAHISSLKLVCQEWHGIINKDFVNNAIRSAYELSGYGEIYERFLNGVLIYRPDGKSDKERIDLPIVKLANPLEGTFDLSKCGDTGKYLSIATGYRKGKKPENADKVEIWFTPRFLIEKELKTTATHFQAIYGNWSDNAPVGMFWTWGGWDDLGWYDYLTTENMDNLSKIDLYENWKKRWVRWYYYGYAGYGATHGEGVGARCWLFMFIL